MKEPLVTGAALLGTGSPMECGSVWFCTGRMGQIPDIWGQNWTQGHSRGDLEAAARRKRQVRAVTPTGPSPASDRAGFGVTPSNQPMEWQEEEQTPWIPVGKG